MRPSYYIALAFAATLVIMCAAIDRTDALKTEMSTLIQGGSSGRHDSRILRRSGVVEGKITRATEEERAFSFKSVFGAKKEKIPEEFAKETLKKMLASPTFKEKMFKVWDEKYAVGQIRQALRLNKSEGYTTLLLSYLNNFKRSSGLRR